MRSEKTEGQDFRREEGMKSREEDIKGGSGENFENFRRSYWWKSIESGTSKRRVSENKGRHKTSKLRADGRFEIKNFSREKVRKGMTELTILGIGSAIVTR